MCRLSRQLSVERDDGGGVRRCNTIVTKHVGHIGALIALSSVLDIPDCANNRKLRAVVDIRNINVDTRCKNVKNLA